MIFEKPIFTMAIAQVNSFKMFQSHQNLSKNLSKIYEKSIFSSLSLISETDNDNERPDTYKKIFVDTPQY